MQGVCTSLQYCTVLVYLYVRTWQGYIQYIRTGIYWYIPWYILYHALYVRTYVLYDTSADNKAARTYLVPTSLDYHDQPTVPFVRRGEGGLPEYEVTIRAIDCLDRKKICFSFVQSQTQHDYRNQRNF